MPPITKAIVLAFAVTLLGGACSTSVMTADQPTEPHLRVIVPQGSALPDPLKVKEMSDECTAVVDRIFLRNEFPPYMDQLGWNSAILKTLVDIVDDESLQGFAVLRAFIQGLRQHSPDFLDLPSPTAPQFRQINRKASASLVFRMREPTNSHPNLQIECLARQHEGLWFVQELQFSRKESDKPMKFKIRATVNPPPVGA